LRISNPFKRSSEGAEEPEKEKKRGSSKARAVDTQKWLSSLPDEGEVRIFQGNNYIAYIDIADLKELDVPLEEFLLNELGPGVYRLIPKPEGEVLQFDKALRVRVGKPEAVAITKKVKPDLESIKEYIDKRIEELKDSRVDLAQLIPSIASALSTLSEMFKGDSDKMIQFMTALVEKTQRDPTELVERVMGIVRELQTMQPPPVQPEGGSSGEEGFFGFLRDLINRLGTSQPQAQPQLAGTTAAAQQSLPSPSSSQQKQQRQVDVKELQALDFFLNRIRDMANSDAPAEDIANAILYMIDTATSWGIKHPLIDRFHHDPGGVFDEIASRIAVFHSAKGWEKARKIREIIVNRVREVQSQASKEEVGDGSAEPASVGTP